MGRSENVKYSKYDPFSTICGKHNRATVYNNFLVTYRWRFGYRPYPNRPFNRYNGKVPRLRGNKSKKLPFRKEVRYQNRMYMYNAIGKRMDTFNRKIKDVSYPSESFSDISAWCSGKNK